MKKDQTKMPLWNKHNEYINKNVQYFDVPGHKKTTNANAMSKVLADTFKYDINSSPEVDFLGHPSGVIEESLKLLADAFDADDSYILTNGTTQGIHILIASSVYPGQKILLPRNSHKSAINGIILAGALPVFINPTVDKTFGITHNISLEDVEKAHKENPDVKALMLLNPTYFGVVSDLKKIAKYCDQHKITLITDEAHGAHFYFHDKFPLGGLQAGSKGTAVSFHKTLGSLTQSSALLWKDGKSGGGNLETKYIWQWIALLATTSPNYLLMSSVDAARSRVAVEGKKLYDYTLKLSKYARKELHKIKGIRLLEKKDLKGMSGAYDLDITKLVIKVDGLGMTGFEFYEILRTKYNIQLELSETKVAMAIITFNDTEESINHLVNAINDIVVTVGKKTRTKKVIYYPLDLSNVKRIMTPRQAIGSPAEEVDIVDAKGRIAADAVMYYPPGIPLILHGEAISQEVIDYYKHLRKEGVKIISSASSSEKVLVVKDLKVELQ